MSIIDRNREIYRLTKQYIRQIMLANENINPDLLDSYLKPNHEYGTLTFNAIYEHLLSHAKNKSQGGGAINRYFGSKDGNDIQVDKWQNFGRFLADFNPHEVSKLTLYELLSLLDKNFGIKEPTIPVYLFCLTIIKGAGFLAQFKNGDEFYKYMDNLYDQSLDAPIWELQKIPGMGPALARDFLKELGYDRYVKPDIHIIEICRKLGLASPKASEENIAQVVQSIAEDAGQSPYSLDRMWWLIGSGNFWKSDEESARARLRWFYKNRAEKRRQDFVEYIKSHLS